jgi:very-short-patch-repair endonuclease
LSVDGGQHGDSIYDAKRDLWLQSEGYKVMRFSNHYVLTNLESVLATLARNLELKW